MVPAITASATLNQNNLFSFLSVSVGITCSLDGSVGGVVLGVISSVSGVSSGSLSIAFFSVSSGSGVGFEVFFLCFAK